VLGLVALSLPAMASAEATVSITKFTAKAVPVPKPGGGSWKGTGNCLGCGAGVEANYEISGEGYGATPQNPKGGIAPISEVDFFLPAGAKIHPSGFGSCTEAALKARGAEGCPKSSIASPVGSLLGEVTFGSERVPEEATLQAFFAPGGGLLFYTQGLTPTVVEVVSTGKWVRSSGKYSWELETLVPAVATVPGAALASVSRVHITAGAARRAHGKVIPYGTVPKRGECPKGGFYGKLEVTFGGMFGGEREFAIPAKTVSKVVRAPCPRR
jgi:hypothetical protein